MTKFVRLLTLLIIVLTRGIAACQSIDEINIAKGAKYILSESPNYSLTSGTDETDLTDGIVKDGPRFWQDASTVGWSNKEKVQIDFDLGSTRLLSRFLINTARNTSAEVEYPVGCFVFVSNDNIKFKYLGDIMLSPRNIPGSYKVESFELSHKAVEGRFVKFVVVSKSKFVFLDEIEIYGDARGRKAIVSERKDVLGEARPNIDGMINDALNESATVRKEYHKIQSERDFLAHIFSDEVGVSSGSNSLKSLEKIREDLVSTRKKLINKVLPRGLVFTAIEDLASLQQFRLIDAVNYANGSEGKKSGTIGPFKFFSIINSGSKPQPVNFQLSENASCIIYEVLDVVSLNKASLKDALKPVYNQTQIEPGENKVFVVSNLVKGDEDELIKIVGSDKKVIATVDLVSLNEEQKADNSSSLNANVWAYMDKPVIRDNREIVANDLKEAGINVVVIHSGFIDDVNSKDFPKLKNYLANFKDLKDKKILLFYNLKGNAESKFKGKEFLDDTWKSNFEKWYKRIQNELSKIGVNAADIYFYPYDEIKPDEADNFIALVKWGKRAIANFKTFVTVIDEKTYRAASHADIVQISKHKVKDVGKINSEEIWVYDVLDHARERNPYVDYRLMAWIAYYYDLKGVGFWNYSALSSKGGAKYDNFINGNEDYSVVYLDDNDKLLSSLRWEYFKRGLIDYKILKFYEDKFGKSRLKKMVKRVIDNQDNYEEADLVITKLKGIKS